MRLIGRKSPVGLLRCRTQERRFASLGSSPCPDCSWRPRCLPPCSASSSSWDWTWLAGGGSSRVECYRTTAQTEATKGPGVRLSRLNICSIVFVFYPMILASLGNHTNGGALGLGSLLIASVLSWRAFLCNRKTPWMRRLVQMPLTAFLTYLVIAEAVAQYRSGKWLWF